MSALRELYDPAIVVRYAEGWPEGSEPGDRVIVRFVRHGVGHGSNLDLEVSSVNTLRKGTLLLLEYFWDHAEALEAVGLSE